MLLEYVGLLPMLGIIFFYGILIQIRQNHLYPKRLVKQQLRSTKQFQAVSMFCGNEFLEIFVLSSASAYQYAFRFENDFSYS